MSPLRRAARAVDLPWAKDLSSVVVCVLALTTADCGSYDAPSTPSPPPSGSTAAPVPAPASPRVVTITSNGVSPVEIITAVGARVTFVNNDVIPHDIFGGPDPSRPDCHEIDAVGFLTPGQSRQTDAFERARTCEYHDHSAHSPYVNGRIVIQ